MEHSCYEYSLLTNGSELPQAENSPKQNVCCHCHNSFLVLTSQGPMKVHDTCSIINNYNDNNNDDDKKKKKKPPSSCQQSGDFWA